MAAAYSGNVMDRFLYALFYTPTKKSIVIGGHVLCDTGSIGGSV